MRKPGKARDRTAYFQEYSDRRRELDLRRRYGLSVDEYADMLAKQNGVCAICGYAPSSIDKSLCVDHCHDTMEVRGLLCQWCNKGLGHFKDSPKLLIRAAEYLTKSLRSTIIKRGRAAKS